MSSTMVWPGKEMRNVFHCPIQECTYWAQAVSHLHLHFISLHDETPNYKCSHCEFNCRVKNAIRKHIYKFRGDTENHSGATISHLKPMPADKYASCIKLTLVGKGEKYGRLDTQQNTLAVDEIDMTSAKSDSRKEDHGASSEFIPVDTGIATEMSHPRSVGHISMANTERKVVKKRRPTLLEGVGCSHYQDVPEEQLRSQLLEALDLEIEANFRLIRTTRLEEEGARQKHQQEIENKNAILLHLEETHRRSLEDAERLKVQRIKIQTGLEELTEWEEKLKNVEGKFIIILQELERLKQERNKVEFSINHVEELNMRTAQVIEESRAELARLNKAPLLEATSRLDQLKEIQTERIQTYLKMEKEFAQKKKKEVKKKEMDWMARF